MPIEKDLFRERVGMYNFDIGSFKQKVSIHNDKCISVMPVKMS